MVKLSNTLNDKKITYMPIPKVAPVEKDYKVMTDKDIARLIDKIKATVRTSLEYKQYIQFLKDEVDMTHCTYFTGVSNKSTTGCISIEIHHEPFRMFDIVNAVLRKFMDKGGELNPLLIAEEVMSLHYRGMVGLLPLSATVHASVHDGKLFIPVQNVYGNYVAFVEEYGEYIDGDTQAIVAEKIQMSKDLVTLDVSLLETRFTYLSVDGFELPGLIM